MRKVTNPPYHTKVIIIVSTNDIASRDKKKGILIFNLQNLFFMNHALRFLVFFAILIVYNSQIHGQIREIKEKSKENQENRNPKPKPKRKPPRTTPPNPKPTPSTVVKKEPVIIDYSPIIVREPIQYEESTYSYSESYDFNGCFYALGALNPIPLFKGKKVGRSNSIYWTEIDPTFVSWDIRALFDYGYHYDAEWHYTYIDFLPGVRLNLGFLMLDYRYNILTEYTDGNPDSFKSWELLALFNLLPKRTIKVFVGTGIHREQFSKLSFAEHYVGTKLGVLDNKNYFDADLRFSIDYKTGSFPFFETGIRYNKRLMNVDDIFGYLTLGAVYQNYYQSHDIWSLSGGIVLNVH